MKLIITEPEIREAVSAYLLSSGFNVMQERLKLSPIYSGSNEDRELESVTFECELENQDIKPKRKEK